MNLRRRIFCSFLWGMIQWPRVPRMIGNAIKFSIWFSWPPRTQSRSLVQIPSGEMKISAFRVYLGTQNYSAKYDSENDALDSLTPSCYPVDASSLPSLRGWPTTFSETRFQMSQAHWSLHNSLQIPHSHTEALSDSCSSLSHVFTYLHQSTFLSRI